MISTVHCKMSMLYFIRTICIQFVTCIVYEECVMARSTLETTTECLCWTDVTKASSQLTILTIYTSTLSTEEIMTWASRQHVRKVHCIAAIHCYYFLY